MVEIVNIDTVLIDLGGVLLTNGWDTQSRKKALEHFHLEGEADEINSMHRLNFGAYELGKMSLDDYIQRVYFQRPRSFDSGEFNDFMFSQSQPFPEMIQMIKDLRTKKAAQDLKVIAISNEGSELMDYRLEKFNLRSFLDAFVVSGYVHLAKPDPDIYQLALKTAGTSIDKAFYIDDREGLVQAGKALGLLSFQHTTLEKTKAKLFTMICREEQHA